MLFRFFSLWWQSHFFDLHDETIYARADSKQKRAVLERAYMDMLLDKTKDGEWQKNQTLLDWLKGLQKKSLTVKLLGNML